jgi:phenylacetate-CoA ligase
MIWNPEKECMSPEEKEELQLRRLKNVVKRAYENVPYYKELFDEAGITPDDIQTLKDIEKIPFTTKTEMRKTYPFGLFAVPEEDIVEIHSTSGTTGKPTVSGYTEKDLDIWGEIVARALTMAGATKKDRIQNSYGYGLFTGGLGIHHGAKKLGATLIPMSAGNTKRQIDVMKDFETTILTCTPSYAAYLAEALEKEGLTGDDISLKAGIFGAEMWTEELRDNIEKSLKITATNIYGLTEIMGPGVSHECQEKNGLHIQDDHFYPEIINPETGETLDYGEKGELVLTTLTREGIPILRFRTKDITTLRKEKCPCGRTTVRMDRITGRSDDMMKIRGVIVFPSQIEKALLSIDGLLPVYQIIATRPKTLDELEIQVEVSESLFSDEVKHMENIQQKIAKTVQDAIGLRVTVTIVQPGTIPRSEGKAVRVIDKRDFS